MGRIAASLREFLKILDSEKLLVHIKMRWIQNRILAQQVGRSKYKRETGCIF